MNNLINIEKHDGKLVVTSRQIAEDFEKDHRVVVRAIENKDESLTAQNCSVENLFIPTTFDHNGNEYKEYLLTRDGFTFIVMGFTGAKADIWKLKYIEAFNKMEQSLKEMPRLSKELQAIIMLDQKTQHVEKRIDTLEYEMPLFNVDCKELQSKVKKIGTIYLGGYKSPAYNDNSLRGKVYADIHNQIKREFGVNRYEAIKRGQLDTAMQIVANYKVPLFLEDQIRILNNQLRIVGKGVM